MDYFDNDLENIAIILTLKANALNVKKKQEGLIRRMQIIMSIANYLSPTISILLLTVVANL